MGLSVASFGAPAIAMLVLPFAKRIGYVARSRRQERARGVVPVTCFWLRWLQLRSLMSIPRASKRHASYLQSHLETALSRRAQLVLRREIRQASYGLGVVGELQTNLGKREIHLKRFWALPGGSESRHRHH